MVRATWNGTVLAESDDTVVVEGNHYFPPDALHRGYFAASEHHSVCPWKSQASYHDIVVDGKVNRAAAWYYPDPRPAAAAIRSRAAFWHGVRVATDGDEADGNDAGPLARPPCAADSPADHADGRRAGCAGIEVQADSTCQVEGTMSTEDRDRRPMMYLPEPLAPSSTT
jgi:uncharacterized protein (DUF427 family)